MHVGNVIKILDAADKTGTTQMKRYSLDMCVKHFDKVASQPNLKTLSKDLLLDIMGAVAIDWPNANKWVLWKSDENLWRYFMVSGFITPPPF